MHAIPGSTGQWEVVLATRETDLGAGRGRYAVRLAQHRGDRTEVVTLRMETTEAGFAEFERRYA